MKTVLIVGSSGFVGSHVLKRLNNRPDVRLIAACRNKNRLKLPFDGEIREGDIRDTLYLKGLMDGVDIVINAMAWTSLWGNEKASKELFLKPSLAIINAYEQSTATRLVNISTTSAASPNYSADAMSEGVHRKFWPHLCNMVSLENRLRQCCDTYPGKSVVNLRLGLFAGEHYALGLLPILLPRLKTHLVPWVAGGKTEMPIIDGQDIAQAVTLSAFADDLSAYNSYNIVGPEIPSVREVISFIAKEYHMPKPHFSVPFPIAYGFAWCMEQLDKVVPWEPLIVRSIIHLLENTGANNTHAEADLGYKPEVHWQQAIRSQVEEMKWRQKSPMKMARSIA